MDCGKRIIAKMAKTNKKYQCKLFPYEIQEVISMQEAKQLSGWNITAFDLPSAWNKTKGEGVKIAAIDSGVDVDHSDLKNNLLQGINLLNKKALPIDDCSHGTFVTGIICAENNEIGMVGVAPKANVIPIKTLNAKGLGNLNTTSEGIRWACDNGADIICMSMGSPRPLQQLRKSIQYASNKGIPIFVAAGNVGKTKEVFYPAAYPETIAIGSIDENFKRSKFSNTGKNLDFMAPGNDIFSTIPGWYGVMSGTSMAAPWAAGIAALLLSYKRNHKTNIKLDTIEDYRNILRSQTISTSDPAYAGSKFFEGFGIIDPRKFVEYIQTH